MARKFNGFEYDNMTSDHNVDQFKMALCEPVQ